MKSQWILLVLFLSSAASQTGHVTLTPLLSGAAKKIGFYSPLVAPLSKNKPAGLTREPATDDAIYAVIDLGGTKTIVLVDLGKLYADTNGDGDLTNDPATVWKPREPNGLTYAGFLQAGLIVGGQRTIVSLGVYKFDKRDSNPEIAASANILHYYTDYAMEGQITLAGQTFNVMLTDPMGTGFQPRIGRAPNGGQVDSGTRLLIDINGNSRFESPAEEYDVAKPFNIKGTTYELSNVTPTGLTVDVSTSPVPERQTATAGNDGPSVAQERSKAESGDAFAQFSLGTRYFTGQGVPQDYALAAQWTRKAAEQGLDVAQFNLARMYEVGTGVPQDYGQAVQKYRNLADKGMAEAQFSLGQLYATGRGVPKDVVEGQKWLNLSVSRSSGDPRTQFAAMRDSMATRLTAAQSAEAQKRAADWQASFDRRKR